MKYSVWPTPAPPVCTAQWSESSWRRFEDAHKPKGYTGGRYDRTAWVDHVVEKEEACCRAFYAAHGVDIETPSFLAARTEVIANRRFQLGLT